MTASIIHGDVFSSLANMPEASVHAVVTSPPYWKLRSYLPSEHPDKHLELGSEKTVEEYLSNMVRVFDGVRRVLRPDGVCFVNLGDSYSGSGKGGYPGGKGTLQGSVEGQNGSRGLKRKSSIDAGNQLLVPHRFALAMQAAGWCLRSTICWAKRSPMPESISGYRWRKCRIKTAKCNKSGQSYCDDRSMIQGARTTHNGNSFHGAKWSDCPGCDKCRSTGGLVLRRGKWRPTTAHEYVYMFSPSGGDYFYSGDSAAETSLCAGNKSHKGETAYVNGDRHHRTAAGLCNMVAQETRNPRSVVSIDCTAAELLSYLVDRGVELPPELFSEPNNPKSVITLSHEPTEHKHFASFPGELVRRCLAGLVGGGCSACGMPFAPIIETKRIPTRPALNPKEWRADSYDVDAQRSEASPNRDPERHIQRTEILGWRQCCGCGAEKKPLVVLDPFAGTGQVGRVANYLGMDSVLIELSAEYVAIMRKNLERPWRPKSEKKPKAPKPADDRQRSLFA